MGEPCTSGTATIWTCAWQSIQKTIAFPMLDSLVLDATHRNPKMIGDNFNTCALEWGRILGAKSLLKALLK